MEHKLTGFELKASGDEGNFTGLLSPYNVLDQGNDIVRPGSYTKNLQEKGPIRPLLFGHKTDCPIGQLTLEDRADGLWCRGELLMELEDAKRAYSLMKAGIMRGLSIGFESLQDKIENGVRYISQIRLWEGSLVLFPMAPDALVTAVKAFNGERKTRASAPENILDDMRLMLRVESTKMLLNRKR